jgi:cysteine-rich repeat protein
MPITGQGQVCASDFDCPTGMRCNGASTCELPRQGFPCSGDADCGTGGACTGSLGCLTGNSNTIGDTCRDTCMLPSCGDGAVDPGTDTNGLGGELCDDGNTTSGDGCDANCTPTGCGNGVVTAGEACDLGRGSCIGGFDDLAACSSSAECRGTCSNQPSQPCTTATAIVDCGAGVCMTGAGCVGGNADGTACLADCTLPAP